MFTAAQRNLIVIVTLIQTFIWIAKVTFHVIDFLSRYGESDYTREQKRRE